MKKKTLKDLNMYLTDDYKCSCGFQFSKPGEFRNCDAFVTEKGESGFVCPKCGTKYISE